MDFEDSLEEAKFRAEARAWLDANAKRKTSRDNSDPLGEDDKTSMKAAKAWQAKKAEKGYVLLRETLKRLKTAGLARVVIRTREYLALVMPRDEALLLMLLRYPQELVSADEYTFPDKKLAAYRVSPKELDMAETLVKSMIGEWQPAEYRDDFRARLRKVIEERVKAQEGTVRAPAAEEAEMPKNAATNVVDFMSLLKKSIDSNKRTPAAERSPSKTAKKAAKKSAKSARKRPAKKRAKAS